MRWSIILLLIAFTGCQAPEDGADRRLASAQSDPLAGFVSDDPCGWDDPLSYHRYNESGGPLTSTGFGYYDDHDDTVLDWGRFYVAVHADGKANLRYFAIDQTESLYLNIDWERDPEECIVRIYDADGTMLLALGNPVPSVPIDVENNVDGFQDAEIVETSFPDLADHLEADGARIKRTGI